MATDDAFKLIPKELTELILSELEPVDLANSSGVNHHWRKLASSDLLWRKFFNDYHNISEPLKVVYGNRKVNWMKRNYKLSILEHPHGTYYIAKTFPGSNILYTGCLADVMEEWDMEKAAKICEYEVPSGPASNYRMDATHCLFERNSALKRWKRHKNAEAYGNEPWDFVFDKAPEENDVWFKCYQCYQFVRERCVMAAVKQPGTLVVHVYDMDRNECLWKHELKVFEPPANPDNDPDYHAYAPKLEWDALSMSYDLAAVVYQEQVLVFDLNKREVKFHLRDEDGEEKGRTFSVSAMHKDMLLASKRLKTNFYSLKDGELLFSVPLTSTANDYPTATLGWAKMDGEKAVICAPTEAYVIDVQKRSLIGVLGWSKVSRGWTQDMAMTDDFLAVLASNQIVLFDFRNRTKEQQIKDTEELKKMEHEYERVLQEEKELREKEDAEAEARYQYRLDHPEEFPDDEYGYRDSASVSSEEQPIIPPLTEASVAANDSDTEDNASSDNWGTTEWSTEWHAPAPVYRSSRGRGERGRSWKSLGLGRGNWGEGSSVEPVDWQPEPREEAEEAEISEPEPEEPELKDEPEGEQISEPEEVISYEEFMRRKAAKQ